MILDAFKIAFRNLTHRKLRSWLTMLGIFIGIAAVVALISLGQGLQEAVTAQFADLGTDKLVIQGKSPGFGPPGLGAVGKITKDDVKLIEKISGVENAVGRLLEPVKVEYNDIVKELRWKDDIIWRDNLLKDTIDQFSFENKEDAEKLYELIELIREIIENKQDYKELPEPRGAYI